MTEPEAVEAISAAFVTGWPVVAPGVPFACENEARTLGPEFALLTTLTTTAQQLTSGGVGTRFVARSGWIQVKLWTPADVGRARADALVQAVRSLFEMKLIVGPDASGEQIDTGECSAQPIGTDGRWFMVLARTPYTVYETK